MVRRILISGILTSAILFSSGCERDGSSDDSSSSDPASGGTVSGDTSAGAVPSDFAGVVWLHNDVSSWSQTATLNASVSGGMINLDYDKARVWPGVNTAGANVNANPWIFVKQDGVWYAGTWEWLRTGQTSKPTGVVNGSHIQAQPLNNFSPKSGETYGFMVSGLARSNVRNVQERSNVSMVVWP